MKKPTKTLAEIWKDKYKELKTELDLLKRIQESQPNQENQQSLRTESIVIDLEVENKKRELGGLKEKLIANDEELKKAQTDDNTLLIKKLEDEKKELEIRLKAKELELLELQKERLELENLLTKCCQELEKKIKEEEKELKNKIENEESVLKGVGRVLTGKNLKELLDDLSSLQEKTAKKRAELKNNEAILQNFNIKVVTKLPHGISNIKLEESPDFWDESAKQYHKIIPNGFLTKEFNDRKIKKKQLPSKLVEVNSFDIKKSGEIKIVETKNFEENSEKNYAILSYSWNAAPWTKFKENTNLTDLIHVGSEKSLRKAVEACKSKKVKVDYLWIDCLCIDQTNKDEIKKELAQVRQYYNNAKVTLVAIQADLNENHKDILGCLNSANEDMEQIFSAGCDIISMVVNSEWFQRSWTFQEGLLSPQTVFMFDDVLIDGRFLAMVWSVKQNPTRMISQLNKKKERENFFRCYSEKATTPLGWSYYQGEYDSNNKVYLDLFQALEASKHRKRYIAKDSICSIIGLLPYEVKDIFEVDKWGKTESSHDGKEEILNLLIKVIKSATENGYGEPLAWYGESNKLTGYCWLPEVLDGDVDTTRNGSLGIEGLIENVKCTPNSVEFIYGKGIKIKGSEYEIVGIESIVDSIGSKMWSKKVWVKVQNGSNKKIRLQGKEKTLKKIMIDDNGKSHILLLIPNSNQWKSNPPVALLATANGDGTYHRIDLVRVIGNLDSTNPEEKLIIGISNQLNLSQKTEKQYPSETHTHIEIPPKK